jgi:hypothetical protein
MTWTGWDGSVWTLTDPMGGVFVVNQGLRGLSMPPVRRFTSKSPAVAGSRFRGSRVDERSVFWPILIYSDGSSAEWAEVDRAFWRTMHPDKPGVWAFQQPNGVTRYLDCRYDNDGDATFERDPHHFGWNAYGVNLIAEQPYWRGERISRTYGDAPGVPFFTGAGGTIAISPGSTISGGSIDNPGDVDGYMVWTVKSTFTSALLGVGSTTIDIPYAQSSDRKLVIDTRPDRLTAYEYALADTNLTGAFIDRTDDLGTADFGSIPAGGEVDLVMNVQGPGINTKIQADLDPLYFRAW